MCRPGEHTCAPRRNRCARGWLSASDAILGSAGSKSVGQIVLVAHGCARQAARKPGECQQPWSRACQCLAALPDVSSSLALAKPVQRRDPEIGAPETLVREPCRDTDDVHMHPRIVRNGFKSLPRPRIAKALFRSPVYTHYKYPLLPVTRTSLHLASSPTHHTRNLLLHHLQVYPS